MKDKRDGLTVNAATEHRLLLVVGAVPHGDPGGVGHRSPDVGSVYQVPEVLHPESRSPLAHGKAQGVHNVGLSWCK